MKASMYNMYLEIDGNYVIFNTLNSKLYLVEEEIFRCLKKNHFEKGPVLENEEILANAGLIIDSEVDEVNMFKHIVDKSIYDNNLRITIVLTANCNFRCQYCYQNKTNKRMSDEVENSIIKYIQKNIRGYKSVYIEWFGGEPLLEKKRLLRMSSTIKEICNQARVPYISSITTNGYLLDKETFTKLVESNCMYFQITVDGMGTLHDTLRPHVSGKGTFDKIIENLLEIKNMENNDRFTIAIRNNISKRHIKEYAAFYDFFETHFANDRRFILIQKDIQNWGGESVKEMANDLFEDDLEMLQFLKENEGKIKQNYSDLHESITNKMCYAFKKNGFAIDWDGSIYKCNKNIENEGFKKKNYLGKIASNGTIKDNDPVSSIWLNKNFHDKCNTCELLPICFTTGCPASWIMNQEMTCMKENNKDKNLVYTVEREFKENRYIKI